MTDLVEVRPDLRLPRHITATEGKWGPDGYDAEVVVEWDEAALAYRVRSLRIEAAKSAISDAGLRRFSMQELLRKVVTDFLREHNPMGPDAHISAGAEDIRTYAAARTYALARALGEHGLKAVADTYGVSQSTATRLVARARTTGVLD